jgi:hypothetical protein
VQPERPAQVVDGERHLAVDAEGVEEPVDVHVRSS